MTKKTHTEKWRFRATTFQFKHAVTFNSIVYIQFSLLQDKRSVIYGTKNKACTES